MSGKPVPESGGEKFTWARANHPFKKAGRPGPRELWRLPSHARRRPKGGRPPAGVPGRGPRPEACTPPARETPAHLRKKADACPRASCPRAAAPPIRSHAGVTAHDGSRKGFACVPPDCPRPVFCTVFLHARGRNGTRWPTGEVSATTARCRVAGKQGACDKAFSAALASWILRGGQEA